MLRIKHIIAKVEADSPNKVVKNIAKLSKIERNMLLKEYRQNPDYLSDNILVACCQIGGDAK